MVHGEEMMDVKDLKRQGLNITQIAEIVGRDPKTVRKYLEQTKPPIYAPRPPVVSKLDQFKPYIRTRMIDEEMTNAVKLGIAKRKAWEFANTRKGYWHIAGSYILSTSLTNERLAKMGFKGLTKQLSLSC